MIVTMTIQSDKTGEVRRVVGHGPTYHEAKESLVVPEGWRILHFYVG